MASVNSVQELKNLVDPIGVYGEYVRLARKGKRSLGLCPFHREKTPSFSVDQETGLFYCFGCHKGGDLLRFLQDVEGCSFGEALEILANRAGVTLSLTTGRSGGFPNAPDRKERLRKALASAERYYRAALKSEQKGSPVRAYLENRGLDGTAVETFALGYAPLSSGLLNHLAGEGFSPEEAMECGLVVEREQGGRAERFRNRLLFPIRDAMGRTVGFGGRAIDAQEPKYLNSPETPVFQKRDVLFGLCWTKEEIRKKGQAVLVEGYMDFVSAYRAGVLNVVAGLGTALSTGQAALLGRYAKEVVLNYDGDSAGLTAAQRAVPILLNHSLAVRVASLPAGKDPDECIKSAGAEAYRQAVADSVPFFRFLVEQAQAKAVLGSVDGRVAFVDSLADYLAAVPDPMARQEFAGETAGRAGLDPNQVLRRLNDKTRGQKDVAAENPAQEPLRVPMNEQMLIKGLRLFPKEGAALCANLPEELRKALVIAPLLDDLAKGKEPQEPARLAMLAFIDNSCDDTLTLNNFQSAVRSLRAEHLLEKNRRIRHQIEDAIQRRDTRLVEILQREITAIAQEVRGLHGRTA